MGKEPNGDTSEHSEPHVRRLEEHAEDILNVRLEVAKRQTRLADFTDAVGRFLAHPAFFAVFLAFHVGWVACNLRFMPWRPWDPYPFTFLATIASVEAPFLALLVLMHQYHEERVTELREEVSLQVNLHIERKASMTLRMLDDLYRKMGYEPEQEGLDQLKKDLDPQHLMESMREELEEAEGEDHAASA